MERRSSGTVTSLSRRRARPGESSPARRCSASAGMPSPPLIEVVSAILGPSQNWMTEQLVRTLGAETGTEGSWSEGFSVIGARLEAEAQMGSGDVHWEDGSGLSNHNLISPRALVSDSPVRPASALGTGLSIQPSATRVGRNDAELPPRGVGREGVREERALSATWNSLSGYLIAADGRELLLLHPHEWIEPLGEPGERTD